MEHLNEIIVCTIVYFVVIGFFMLFGNFLKKCDQFIADGFKETPKPSIKQRWFQFRTDLFHAILRKCGIGEGYIIPKYLIPVRILLFPSTIVYFIKTPYPYDPLTNTIQIGNVRVTAQFIAGLAWGIAPGVKFSVVKRENGVIHFSRHFEPNEEKNIDKRASAIRRVGE